MILNPFIGWLTALPAIKHRCFCGEGLHSQIQCHHKAFLSYLITSKTENNQWGKERHWDSKWPQPGSLDTTGQHTRKTGSRLYFIERNYFRRWLLEACWPSDLFHLVYHHPWLKSHVASPAVLLWWKNWVINRCQSHHSSGNSDFSISGHWRTTQAQSWPTPSLNISPVTVQLWQDWFLAGHSLQHFKKQLPG